MERWEAQHHRLQYILGDQVEGAVFENQHQPALEVHVHQDAEDYFYVTTALNQHGKAKQYSNQVQGTISSKS